MIISQNNYHSIVNLPADLDIADFILNSISIAANVVESVLKSRKNDKASGPEAFNNIILKELVKPLSFPLSDLFNASLIKGQVSAIWKQANETSVHKKNDTLTSQTIDQYHCQAKLFTNLSLFVYGPWSAYYTAVRLHL